MNAISMQVQDELRQAAADIGADPGIRAAVIYGGEKVFAAGVDVKEMASEDYPTMALARQPLHAAFRAIAKIPKPVVSAVTGFALGGGMELALRADFRVCGERTQFGQPEILLGIIPGAGGTQRLPRASMACFAARRACAGSARNCPASRVAESYTSASGTTWSTSPR